MEFRKIAYVVMEIVFAVHNEMGSLFDELVNERGIVQRIRGAQAEVRIEVAFESFRKLYSMDLLVASGAPFELKAAERIIERHRSQFINYLLLAELRHGKLINLRGELVEHEFVNAPLTRQDRTKFQIESGDYCKMRNGGPILEELVVAVLRDWGTCLDLALYEDAIIHFLGGRDHVLRQVEITMDGKLVGQQKLMLLSPDTSVCVSVLNKGQNKYEQQLRRFIQHTPLRAIQWVNIGRKMVTFKTIQP